MDISDNSGMGLLSAPPSWITYYTCYQYLPLVQLTTIDQLYYTVDLEWTHYYIRQLGKDVKGSLRIPIATT